jgi:TonB family protein
MPIIELFPKPSRDPDQTPETTGDPAADQAAGRASQPLKLRTRRYGELEEHEIIHLLDSLDDERSRARFRESIYISIIIYLALAWFLFYGPRVLWHQPRYIDPIALMKQHDQDLTFLQQHSAPVLKPSPPHPQIDRKTMEQLQQQARLAAPTPQPPQQEASTAAPPVPQPAAPLPAAPKPAQPSVESPLPAAPKPNFAQNNQSARGAIQDALRGAFGGRGGGDYGPSSGSHGPLQAGAEILSDTMGVDFSSYMRRLHDDIQRNWDPLIPEEVQPPLMKKGIVGIRFTILPDGKIGAMTLETRSGDVALDHAAWNAITSEGQFPPLPRQFHGPQLELRVGFFYNIPLPE